MDEYLELMSQNYVEDLDKYYTTSATTTGSAGTATSGSALASWIAPSCINRSSLNTTWGQTTINNTWQNTWAYPNNNNVFHNPRGPASVTKDAVQWYIDGKQIFSTKLFCLHANHTEESTIFWLLAYGDKLPATPEEYKYLEADIID